MFASEGEQWEKKHAILQPMMKLSMIEGNIRQIIQKAVISTDILEKNMDGSNKSSIEILHVLRQGYPFFQCSDKQTKRLKTHQSSKQQQLPLMPLERLPSESTLDP
jgi:hypothetical protein